MSKLNVPTSVSAPHSPPDNKAAQQPNQDRLFCPQEYAALQNAIGKQFTLDACCNDSGDNALAAKFCSPSDSFLQHTVDNSDVIWLNAPFNSLQQFVQHYVDSKARSPGASGCIVVPKIRRFSPAELSLFKGMDCIAEYSKGSRLFYVKDPDGTRRLMPGIPWGVRVY